MEKQLSSLLPLFFLFFSANILQNLGVSFNWQLAPVNTAASVAQNPTGTLLLVAWKTITTLICGINVKIFKQKNASAGVINFLFL